MPSADVLALFAELARSHDRVAAAAALARRLGAEDVIVFIEDPGVRQLLPAMGFAQTLPEGRSWRTFVHHCLEQGVAKTKLPFPEPGAIRRATGIAANDGSVMVLLGGDPRPDDIAEARMFLPLLAATFRAERRAIAGEGHAAAASAAAEQSERLASSLARTQAELQTALREVQAADQQKEELVQSLARSNQDLDQFAYIASHDLKAPLRGIANLSQWIEEDLADRMTDEAREQMRLLRGRVHRLEALIDGVLSYSRAGRVREKPEAVDTGKLLRDVIELLAPPPGATIDVQPAMPTVRTERIPLQQVFLNLVGNALKYAARPDPLVEVRARDAGTHWQFSVRDNGPGIAPEFHARIWGIFQTLEARDKVEGTGIGLSVVQKVIETRGGRVWVESSPGAGATFYFTLPKRPKEVK